MMWFPPLQVVDMFGAGLPTLAVHFSCLDELVRHDVNGRVFRTATELARDLAALFRGFPGEPACSELARLSRGAAATVVPRWEVNWQENARPLFAT
jgi:beta-1,4-mannosyltransferase